MTHEDASVEPYMIKKTRIGEDFLYWDTTSPTWVLVDNAGHIVAAYDDEVISVELLAEIESHTSTIDVNDFDKYETVWNVDGEIKEKMYVKGVWPIGFYGEIQMPLFTAHVTFWNTIGDSVKVQSIMYDDSITFTPFQTKHIFDMLGIEIGGFDPCCKEEVINARSPYILLIMSDPSTEERKGYERRINYRPAKTCNTATWELTKMLSGNGIEIVLRGGFGDISREDKKRCQ